MNKPALRSPLLYPLWFLAICPWGPARGQDISALPAAKMAPGECPGSCIQIPIRNVTRHSQELRLRRPGGNWQTFSIAPGTGLNFRCTTCGATMEARLPDDDEGTRISSGVEYEIKDQAAPRQAVLVPKGG
ncbi:MAG TPA: hypothetical protein VGC09_11410 [Rhodopila sp.]